MSPDGLATDQGPSDRESNLQSQIDTKSLDISDLQSNKADSSSLSSHAFPSTEVEWTDVTPKPTDASYLTHGAGSLTSVSWEDVKTNADCINLSDTPTNVLYFDNGGAEASLRDVQSTVLAENTGLNAVQTQLQQ